MAGCTIGVTASLAVAMAVTFAAEDRQAMTPEPPPGVVVAHSPITAPSPQRFIGTPSLAILPNGSYVASHDLFGPGHKKQKAGLTRVYLSHDRGRSWQPLSEVPGACYAKLFVHRGLLYLLGMASYGGETVIRRSEDGGKTWTQPMDANSGRLLLKGLGGTATPVIENQGRLWRVMGSTTISASSDANLLEADSWSAAKAPPFDKKTWLEGKFEGWSEGGPIVTPEGGTANFIKVKYYADGDDRAAIIRVHPDGHGADFDPARDFVHMPGARLKFTVRWDSVSQKYWALTNHLPRRYYGGDNERIRNTVALISSPDLRQWTVDGIVLFHPDTEKHGFQYLDWEIDGDDIVAVCRTAWPDGQGGPENQHDTNYLTFHRFEKFRDRTPAEWNSDTGLLE